MFRKLTPWFIFIMLKMSTAAPQAHDTVTPQAPGEDSPQAVITDAPMPHIPGTASKAIKTINSFIESIQNTERSHHKEDAGNTLGS